VSFVTPCYVKDDLHGVTFCLIYYFKDGRIILIWIFRKRIWTGSSWLRIGTGASTCECGKEPAGSIKCGEFLD